MHSLSKHGLTQCIIYIRQLILNLLLCDLLSRLKLGLYHAYDLSDFPIQEVFLDGADHASVSKHNDSEADDLGDLRPHISGAHYLGEQEEKEKLRYLGV